MSEPRRRLPREQRRRAIMAAARDVLLERGYGELTMERVGERAGVSKALVYDHFAHRRELYLALLAEEQMKLVQRLTPSLASGDNETRVSASIRAALELMYEYGDGYLNMFRNPIAHDPELAVELLRGRDSFADIIAQVLGSELGVATDEARLYAQAIVGAMEAASEWISRIPADERPPVEEAAQLLIRLVWTGLQGVETAAARPAARAVRLAERR